MAELLSNAKFNRKRPIRLLLRLTHHSHHDKFARSDEINTTLSGRELLFEQQVDKVCVQPHLKQVLEVQILLVRHILQAVLAMNLSTSLVKLLAHGVIDKLSGKTGSLALVALLLLHPGDEEDLADDDGPENAPDGQDTLEGVDLGLVSKDHDL